LSSSEIDIAIFNAYILTIDNRMTVFNRGYLLIKESKIIDIGPMDNFHSKYGNSLDIKQEIEANGDIVLPGFVNAHGHFAMTLFRGIADDLPLMKWLQDYIWPIENKMTPKDCFIGTQLAAIEMIQGGTTSACDMYFNEDKSLDALEEIGFRGILGHGMLDFGNPDKGKQEVASVKKFIEYAKRKAKICSLIISPHASNTCSDELLLEAKQMAEKNKLPLQIHLSETQSEVAEVKKSKNCSPVEHLDKIGFLDSNLVAAHCVWLSDNDCKILQKHQVSISHNPSSNLKLGSGIFRFKDLSILGINIALGTDGAASNNNLSMLQELRLASYLHKGININPEILPAKDAIRMATINGAKALGQESNVGSLEIGKRADIIIVDTKTPNVWPPHDPYSLITFCAQDANIRTTIIDGRIVMQDWLLTTINTKKIMTNAKEAITRLINEADLKQFNDKQIFLQ